MFIKDLAALPEVKIVLRGKEIGLRLISDLETRRVADAVPRVGTGDVAQREFNDQLAAALAAAALDLEVGTTDGEAGRGRPGTRLNLGDGDPAVRTWVVTVIPLIRNNLTSAEIDGIREAVAAATAPKRLEEHAGKA